MLCNSMAHHYELWWVFTKCGPSPVPHETNRTGAYHQHCSSRPLTSALSCTCVWWHEISFIIGSKVETREKQRQPHGETKILNFKFCNVNAHLSLEVLCPAFVTLRLVSPSILPQLAGTHLKLDPYASSPMTLVLIALQQPPLKQGLAKSLMFIFWILL